MKSVLIALAVSVGVATGIDISAMPWMDAQLPVYERVDLLMNEMTLEERCRQTWAVHNFKWQEAGEWANASVGSIKLSAFPNTTYQGVLEYRNTIMKVFYEGSRLGIPTMFHQETLLSAAPNATNIPLPVTLGSSWDTDLVKRVHAMVASELRAVGGDVGYSPEVNLYTDPRFGRLQEGFSADSTLTSELGVAATQGFQGADSSGPGDYLAPAGAAALGKHFIAYGPAAGGQNVGRSLVSPRELVDRFAAPWRQMMRRAGLRALMPAHQTVFGVPAHGNAWLGQTILRGDPARNGGVGLNFSGFSTSDCSDIGALISWGLAPDSEHAAALGMGATVDMDNMCSTNADDGAWSYTELQKAVQDGLVPEAAVNASARRVLAQKFAAGLFDSPYVNASGLAVVGSPAHLAVSYEAAVKGAVLLKNAPPPGSADPALPLPEVNSSGSVIAVIGPLATCGPAGAAAPGRPAAAASGFCEAQEGYLGKPQHPLGDLDIPTVSDAAAQDAGSTGFTLRVAQGSSVEGACDDALLSAAQAAASGASAALVVLGDSVGSCAEWGDRQSLGLPGCQARLLSTVLAADPRPAKVVVALANGRPYTLAYNGTDLTPGVDGLLVAWRGGQFGGRAIWDLVAGRQSPTGRLPQAWLRSVGQVNGPATTLEVNGKWIANQRGPEFGPEGVYPYNPYTDSDSTPLYPLGFGLGYGGFVANYSKVSVSCPANVATSDAVACTATVTVTNPTGSPGVETVQLYVSAPTPTAVVRDWRRLAGFAKVPLQPGASADVSIDIRADVLAVTEPNLAEPLGGPSLGSRHIAAGSYFFVAGTNRLDAATTTMANVPESTLVA